MKVALIGNPNSGKTSLFNKLTGLNQKIGNWPGVTIEKKEGKILKTDIEIFDLPGVYSLTPYSAEEIVSRDYLINEKPDLVINVVDSTALERSLFLTTQLLDLGLDVVLSLNMTDLLKKKGIILDEEILSKKLGVSAIKVSAKSGQGVAELVKLISLHHWKKSNVEIYSKFIQREIDSFKKEENINNNFLSLECLSLAQTPNAIRAKKVIEKVFKFEFEQLIANEKYSFISAVKKDCVKYEKEQKSTSDRLDKIFLNKYLAIPIFALIMTFVYVLSIGVVGKFCSGFLEKLFDKFSSFVVNFLEKYGTKKWLISLLVNGIIAGVCSVLTFVPELITIFLCMSILESTGYMSRISLMFDRLFRKFGLSGKSLVPFIVGTACSVPAISSTRTIENNDERIISTVLTPFVPCSAKLPIISLFVGAFFPTCSGLVTASLYFFAIALILISGVILRKFVFKNKTSSFVLELPEYKTPSAKYVARDVFDKTKDFISRVGTIIVFCSILVWFLSSFNFKFQYINDIQNSILAKVGNLFAWFFYPIIGEWNWAVSVSAIQGLVAKEQVVSSMSVIAGVSGGKNIFSSVIFSGFSKISAYAFVVFNLFSAPCISAIGAMKNELKSKKKAMFAVLFQIGFAWIVSSLIFLLGSFIGGLWSW